MHLSYQSHTSLRIHSIYRQRSPRSSAVGAVTADRTAYWQTIKPVSATSLRTAGTHDPIQRAEFMNAPKLCLSVTIERDRPYFSSSRRRRVTERITLPVHAWLSVSKKTHVRVFFDSFFSVRFVAKRYILQHLC